MTEDIHAALETLRQGGVILYPTDTIWGLGCDATNNDAVRKISRIKNRDDRKSMLVLLDEADKLSLYMDEVPEIAWEILEVTDKPLTIIYPGVRNLAESLVAEDGSAGIRVVQDAFCRRLIRELGKPVVSSSANISGLPWPSSFHEIDEGIVKSADYVVRYRQHDEFRARPSGIIKLGLNGEIKVIRE